MGIESDRLVYDYLSRVGDLAQQRQLPASDRMKLVSGLRNEIDRRRATHGEESPAAVRGILGALGTPDEVVDRAGPSGGPGAAPVPEPRTGQGGGTGTGRTRGLRRAREAASDKSGNPRRASGASAPGGPGGREGAGRAGVAPGAAGSGRPGASRPAVPAQDDRGPDGPAPGGRGPADSGSGGAGIAAPAADRAADWWRTDTEDPSDEDGFFGFVGGIERPDLFTPPAPEEDEDDAAEEPAPGKARRLARVLRRRKAEAPAVEEAPEEAAPARARLSNPFVLLAALLLLGGAVFGSLVALAAGWLLAYASRRLTPGEARTAVLVIPGLAAATGIVWLWGRVQGRWGEAVAPGGEAMGAAISETWPWVLRGAAIASAAFLVWRARRN
ncbi:hypothetical protein [Streptomyces sp. NPDC003863]